MRLSPQWTTITSHALGAREVLLVQNAETGQSEVASFDDDGKVTTVLTSSFGAGWGDVVSSNGFLLFYDYRTGRAAIYTIDYDDYRGYSRSLPGNVEFSRGWTALGSDGHGVLFYNYATQAAATGAITLVRRPSDLIYRQDLSLDFSDLPRFSVFARCRNQIVLYAFDGTRGIYFSTYLTTNGELRWAYGNPSGQTPYLPPYTHAVGMQHRLFFYDALGGDGEVGRLTQEGRYIRLKTLQFSPWWSHVVATDYRVLFYRSSTGEAVTGYFDPAGDFVQQQTYF